MNKEKQVFSFCLRCQRIALIKDKACGFCNGGFILQSPKGDFNNNKVKKHYKQKKIKTL